jgi:hypothetical protein
MSENDGTRRRARADVEKASRWLPSLVWLIPLAAVIGLTLVVKSVLDQGPTVIVSFRSADGLEPGKTKVIQGRRYWAGAVDIAGHRFDAGAGHYRHEQRGQALHGG